MSVERLIGNDLGPIRTEQKNAEGQQDKSPVWIIAQAYINQGRNRIIELSKSVTGRETTARSPKDIAASLNSKDTDSLILSQTAIFMGVCLQTIERILVDKKFNVKEMIDNYNAKIIGTPWEKAQMAKDENPILDVPFDAWKKMIKCAKSDPSLSTFFVEIDLLPKVLQELIIQTGTLQIIRSSLLPPYKKQYQILAEERAKQKLRDRSRK